MAVCICCRREPGEVSLEIPAALTSFYAAHCQSEWGAAASVCWECWESLSPAERCRVQMAYWQQLALWAAAQQQNQLAVNVKLLYELIDRCVEEARRGDGGFPLPPFGRN